MFNFLKMSFVWCFCIQYGRQEVLLKVQNSAGDLLGFASVMSRKTGTLTQENMKNRNTLTQYTIITNMRFLYILCFLGEIQALDTKL